MSETQAQSRVYTLPIVGVGVIVLRNGKIAMGQRRQKGVWTLPGGKVDPFESIVEGGRRELTEETGLDADNLELFAVYEFIEQAENYHTTTFAALTRSARGELSNPEPQLFIAWDWFDFANLPAPLFPPSYHLLSAYQAASGQAMNLPQCESAMVAHGRLLQSH